MDAEQGCCLFIGEQRFKNEIVGCQLFIGSTTVGLHESSTSNLSMSKWFLQKVNKPYLDVGRVVQRGTALGIPEGRSRLQAPAEEAARPAEMAFWLMNCQVLHKRSHDWLT